MVTAREVAGLTAWLRGAGGILVTHNKLYTGMEAPAVVFISARGGDDTGTRSGRLRAVARLVYISSSSGVDRDVLEQHYTIVNLEQNSG